MKNIKYNCKGKDRWPILTRGKLLTIAVCLLALVGYSQTPQIHVAEDWTSTSATQNTFQRSIVRTATLSGTIYTYVCGATLSGTGDYDMLVEKFSPGGSLIWAQTYDYAGGDDVATDVRIATNGEVYICGSYYKDATDSNNAVIIKYAPNGTQRWVATYNGSGSRNDGYSALLQSGNSVFAVGTCWSTSNKYDMIVRRIDTAGATGWTTNYDNSGLNDGAVNLSSRSGSIFVTGAAETVANTTYKIATLKINPANGAITTTTLSSGIGLGIDRVTDIQEDATGNVYITGTVFNGFTTFYDIHTVKYDANLAQVWATDYNGSSSLDDVGTSLSIDSLGNVIVTGYTNTITQGKNYITIKYNSSGSQQWATAMNGVANGKDSATAVVTLGTNIYVTGMSYNGNNYDYYTVKYNTSGTQQWGIAWNSATDDSDVPTSIATDTARAIIVTGQTNGATNYTTVRYVESSILTPTSSENFNSSFWFTENRGQLRTTDDKPTAIKYYNRTGGNQQQVYFADDKLSYVWAKLDTSQTSPQDTTFRVDMTFKNGKSAKISPNTPPRDNYENFFYPYIPDGCSRMKTYDQLVRPSIYNNIDVVYSSNYAGMKYYYVVKSGASPTTISEVYAGLDSVVVNGSGDLIIYTYLGNIQRPKPTVWEIDGSGTVTTLAWNPSYNVSGDTVSFSSIGSYDVTKTLILEIKNASVSALSNHIGGTNMEWSTHYAHQTTADPFTSVRADKDGNSFYAGYVYGANFPFQSGMQQFANSGTWDFDFVKVNPDATCKFSTYCGGSGWDNNFLNMTTDTLGFMYFAGYSASGDFPLSNPGGGAYLDSTLDGAHDIIIGKLDTTGTFLVWSTYYGGTANETPNGIAVTPAGDRIIVVGETTSSNFPIHARSGAYSSSTGKSFIIEFDPQLDTVWSTRFGTQAHVKDVDIDQYGDIFVVGKNEATNGNLPFMHQAGSYWDSIAVWNAFIIRFNTADTVSWATAFGGTGGGSTGASSVICSEKDVYVAGEMEQDPATFPLMFSGGDYIDSTINYLQNPDMFIAKFRLSGVETWCTLHGEASMETVSSLCVDDNGTVYIVGTSRSYNFDLFGYGNSYVVAQTNSFFNDGAIVAFSPYNTLRWSTCYGGTDLEFINDVAASNHDKLFITGVSQSTPVTFPWNFPNLVTGEIIDTLKTNSDQTGIMARFDLTDVSVGVNEQNVEQGGNMLIFPNPTTGNLTVQVNDLQGEDVLITVYDLVGQVIINRKTENNFGTLQVPLDFVNLSNGVYLVSVQVGEQTIMTKKVIKQQ